MERREKNNEAMQMQRIKLELVAAHERGQAGLLGQAIRGAPAQSEALADFVAGLYATDLTEQEAALPLSAEVEALSQRARQRALRVVFSVVPVAQVVQPKMASLAQARSANGFSLVELARQLGLGADVLRKLEHGRIVAASVPQRLVERLAGLLTLTSEQVWSLLRLPPTTQAQPALMRQRTVGRAEQQESQGAEPQTFAQAVLHSPSMQPEQRKAWLNEAGA